MLTCINTPSTAAVRRGGLRTAQGLYKRPTPASRPTTRARQFTSSRNLRNSGNSNSKKDDESFASKAGKAWRNTKIEWRPIPIGLGIAFLGLLQLYRNQRDAERLRKEELEGDNPPRRKKIRPSGPWQVQVMSTLPLKALSRLWGRFNELDLPGPLRIPGFKLYAWIFGANLDEMAEPDLRTYPNLASFFYRELKPGARPIDQDPDAIVSPSDGKVLSFGMIERGEVEQVKGMTYSLEALLGGASPSREALESHGIEAADSLESHGGSMAMDEEFARVNGISYTLPHLLSGSKDHAKKKTAMDASTASQEGTEAKVKADLALGDGRPWYAPKASHNALYYCVIYLAPGDYHRFHSPISWVVESRRHFAGELYSVSPYLQRTLPGLFVLNERVVLLGRWRWGFFSYIPVGATNVGSVKLNFDAELRTNSLTTDTEADKAAAEAAKRGEAYSGFAEATYYKASPALRGHPLQRGEEMGGFQLGSTVVLVFEAPMGVRKSFDEGWGSGREGGFKWKIDNGQTVRVGQTLGHVET
jgi:phosphatidylserine decarboxylase